MDNKPKQEPEQKCCDKCVSIGNVELSAKCINGGLCHEQICMGRNGIAKESYDIYCINKFCSCHSPKEAPKEHKCSECPATWRKGGWVCDGCGKKNKCTLMYEQFDVTKLHPDPCCPDYPHSKQEEVKEKPFINIIKKPVENLIDKLWKELDVKDIKLIPTPEKSWEEQLEDRFLKIIRGQYLVEPETLVEIKDFIRKELASQREEIMKKFYCEHGVLRHRNICVKCKE